MSAYLTSRRLRHGDLDSYSEEWKAKRHPVESICVWAVNLRELPPDAVVRLPAARLSNLHAQSGVFTVDLKAEESFDCNFDAGVAGVRPFASGWKPHNECFVDAKFHKFTISSEQAHDLLMRLSLHGVTRTRLMPHLQSVRSTMQMPCFHF